MRIPAEFPAQMTAPAGVPDEAVALRQRLQQRELEVAELIDELGHLQGLLDAAPPSATDAAPFADAVAALLAYLGWIERSVVLPALGVADAVSTADAANVRARALAAAASVDDPRVAGALQCVERPAAAAELDVARRFRASIRDALVVRPPRLSTEDAFVVCGALVESQMELRELSAAALRALRKTGASSVTARDVGTSTDLSGDFVNDVRNGLLDPLRDELTALRRDVNRLDTFSDVVDASALAALTSELTRARAACERSLHDVTVREAAAAAAVEAAAAATSAAAEAEKNAAVAASVPPPAVVASATAVAELQAVWYAERTHLLAQLAAYEDALSAARLEHTSIRESLEAARALAEDRLAERDAFRKEADRLRTSLVTVGSSTAGNSVVTADTTRAAHEAHLELDRITREHSAALTAAHSEAAALRTENLRLRQSLAGSSSHRGALDSLQRENERLQQELNTARAHHVDAHAPMPSEDVAPLRATVQRLGEEVALTEGRMREAVRGRDEDRARYEQLLRDERTRSQQERDECDLLVWRMSREIDTLARDNLDLKKRLDQLCDQ